MKRYLFILLWLIVFIPSALFSQEFAKVGTAGAQFLKIGVGARGIGMSEAFSAVCNDASSIYWNPAGLTYVKNTSILLAHTNWLVDISYEATAIAKTVKNIGTFGFSVAYLSSGDIEETTVEMQNGTGRTFNAGNLMVGISYAKQLSDKFSIGGNVKYIEERLDTDKAWAWAVDVGTLYYTGFNSLRMGLYIRNFGPELKIDGTYVDYDDGSPILDPETQAPEQQDYLPYHMPMTFAAGLAYDFFEASNQKLTVAMDLLHPNDNVEKLAFGAEVTLFNIVAIRAGYISPFNLLGRVDGEIENREERDEYSLDVNNYTQTFSAGMGLQVNMPTLGNLSLDYAYTDFGILDWVHRGSILINF